MHAVVIRVTLHDREQATTFLREQAIPRLRQAPGFVAGQWVNLGENSGTSMVTFENDDAAQAAVEQLKSNPPPSNAVEIDSIEVGEVVERI
jgi:hypothetical protein